MKKILILLLVLAMTKAALAMTIDGTTNMLLPCYNATSGELVGNGASLSCWNSTMDVVLRNVSMTKASVGWFNWTFSNDSGFYSCMMNCSDNDALETTFVIYKRNVPLVTSDIDAMCDNATTIDAQINTSHPGNWSDKANVSGLETEITASSRYVNITTAVDQNTTEIVNTIIGNTTNVLSQIDSNTTSILTAIQQNTTDTKDHGDIYWNTTNDTLTNSINSIESDTNELQGWVSSGRSVNLTSSALDDIDSRINTSHGTGTYVGTGASAGDIANAVWNETVTGHTKSGMAGTQLWNDTDDILTDTNELQVNQSYFVTAIGFETESTANSRYTNITENQSTIYVLLTTVEGYVDDVEGYINDVTGGGLETIYNYLTGLNNLSAIDVDTQLNLSHPGNWSDKANISGLETEITALSRYANITGNQTTLFGVINTILSNQTTTVDKLDVVIGYVDDITGGGIQTVYNYITGLNNLSASDVGTHLNISRPGNWSAIANISGIETESTASSRYSNITENQSRIRDEILSGVQSNATDIKGHGDQYWNSSNTSVSGLALQSNLTQGIITLNSTLTVSINNLDAPVSEVNQSVYLYFTNGSREDEFKANATVEKQDEVLSGIIMNTTEILASIVTNTTGIMIAVSGNTSYIISIIQSVNDTLESDASASSRYDNLTIYIVSVNDTVKGNASDLMDVINTLARQSNLTQGIILLTSATESQIDEIETDTDELQLNQTRLVTAIGFETEATATLRFANLTDNITAVIVYGSQYWNTSNVSSDGIWSYILGSNKSANYTITRIYDDAVYGGGQIW